MREFLAFDFRRKPIFGSEINSLLSPFFSPSRNPSIHKKRALQRGNSKINKQFLQKKSRRFTFKVNLWLLFYFSKTHKENSPPGKIPRPFWRKSIGTYFIKMNKWNRICSHDFFWKIGRLMDCCKLKLNNNAVIEGIRRRFVWEHFKGTRHLLWRKKINQTAFNNHDLI